MEEVLEHEADVVLVEILGRLEAELERAVARAIGGEGLELHQHGRDQVEGDLDLGELAHERDHAVIVLEGMQAHPRQDVLVSDQILVERLVHVPQDGNASHGC